MHAPLFAIGCATKPSSFRMHWACMRQRHASGASAHVAKEERSDKARRRTAAARNGAHAMTALVRARRQATCIGWSANAGHVCAGL
jgi:hypothetical protein